MTYQALKRREKALQMRRDVYSGYLRCAGEENPQALEAANNYADSLGALQRFEEARSVLRKAKPVARRVLGESNDITLRLRMNYARALFADPAATLDDLREAVNTIEDTQRIARRVFGDAHPLTKGTEYDLKVAALRVREETQPSGGA